jgi:hypothetical protein
MTYSTAAARSGATTGASITSSERVAAVGRHHRARTGCLCGTNIGTDIADHHNLMSGDAECFGRGQDHPRAGFRQVQPSSGEWGQICQVWNGPSNSSTRPFTAASWFGEIKPRPAPD